MQQTAVDSFSHADYTKKTDQGGFLSFQVDIGVNPEPTTTVQVTVRQLARLPMSRQLQTTIAGSNEQNKQFNPGSVSDVGGAASCFVLCATLCFVFLLFFISFLTAGERHFCWDRRNEEIFAHEKKTTDDMHANTIDEEDCLRPSIILLIVPVKTASSI